MVADAAVQRLLLHLEQQRHRDAGVQEVHRDAAAHGAGADHAPRGRSGAVGVSSGTSGILAGGALGRRRCGAARATRASISAWNSVRSSHALVEAASATAARRLDAPQRRREGLLRHRTVLRANCKKASAFG
jgi:hypothetical protein